MVFQERTPLSPIDEEQQTQQTQQQQQQKRGFLASMSCYRLFNVGAITILSVCVGLLFLQMQVVTYKVSVEQERVNDLVRQIQTKQQDEIHELSDQVEREQTHTVLLMAGTFTLLTCLVTGAHMTSHLRNYHEPIVQRKILAILWMSPIYSLTSFLSLVIPALFEYLSILKDFYEAFLIYTFLSFLIAVLGRGNREVAVRRLAQSAAVDNSHDYHHEGGDDEEEVEADDGQYRHKHKLAPPSRCFNRFYHPPPSESPLAMANAVLTECQILTMQFVLTRPLTSIANFVILAVMDDDESSGVPSAESTGDDTDDTTTPMGDDDPLSFLTSPLFFTAMIQNVSVFLAFSGLLKFYHAVRDELAWCQPFPKFMCIKGIVFLTFWQGLVLHILIVSLHGGGRWEDANQGNNNNKNDDEDSNETKVQAAWIQNVLICLEMLFFAIAHWCVFPTEEWKEDYRPRRYAKPGIGLKDFVSDVSVIIKSRRNASALHASGTNAITHETNHDGDGDDDDDDLESRNTYTGSELSDSLSKHPKEVPPLS